MLVQEGWDPGGWGSKHPRGRGGKCRTPRRRYGRRRTPGGVPRGVVGSGLGRDVGQICEGDLRIRGTRRYLRAWRRPSRPWTRHGRAGVAAET